MKPSPADFGPGGITQFAALTRRPDRLSLGVFALE
jgi:hypothetical protein